MIKQNQKDILVQVRHVSKNFDVSDPWLTRMINHTGKMTLKAVEDLNFEIHKGEILSLVGESGCGKSTTAKLLCGLYEPSAGEITVDGVSLSALNNPKQKELAKTLRRRINMIFQDPFASLNPRWRVRDIIAEPIVVQKLLSTQKQIDERVDELMSLVKLNPEDADKFPHQFSGGQRQRISIARALASNPEFLICDEPTSALDVSVQAQILNLAPKKKLFASPKHPYTKMLLDAIPDINMTGKPRVRIEGEVPNPLNPPSGCAFHPRCPYATERCRKDIPQLMEYEEEGQKASVACHLFKKDESQQNSTDHEQ